jgi:hypothetical protein
VAAVATGCFGQPSLVEGGDLDQLDQLDLLHQQLCDAVAAMHHDRRGGVEVDQRDLDLATIARIDGAGTIDDRKPYARRQSGARMDQPHHAQRDRNRNARSHQGALPWRQLEVFGAEEINPGVTFVRATRHRKPWVEADYGKTVRHGATDYP